MISVCYNYCVWKNQRKYVVISFMWRLVDKGFVIRMQNPDNRRVINIRLTDEAMRFMEKMKNEILDDILGKFSSVSDSDMKKMKDALVFINSILKKVLK